jgi:spore germination cell wall hydrolase CwlJ-like protein
VTSTPKMMENQARYDTNSYFIMVLTKYLLYFQSKKKKKDKKKHKHKHKHHKHKKDSNREGKHSHPASPATPLNAKDETLSSASSSPSQASQDVAF